jgi:hypothetical protein
LQHRAIVVPLYNKMFSACQAGDLSVPQWRVFSVKVAAAQKEAAGLAHHFAA